MNYSPYLLPNKEITLEKIDKVAKTLNGKLKGLAKFLVIFLSWLIFNAVVALFFNASRSFSPDFCCTITDNLRQALTQEAFLFITFVLDNKFGFAVAVSILFAYGVSFFVRLLADGNFSTGGGCEHKRNQKTDRVSDKRSFVVSYKFHVAYLA